MCSILLSKLSVNSSLDEIFENIYTIYIQYCSMVLMIMNAFLNYNILYDVVNIGIIHQFIDIIYQFTSHSPNEFPLLLKGACAPQI